MRSTPLLLLGGLLFAGCVPQGSISFTQSSTPPTAVVTTSSTITIPAGIAVRVDAQPMISGEKVEDGTGVTLTPRDTSVIGIRTTKGKAYQFVLFGKSPGATTIDVQIGDAAPAHITATVTSAR